MHRKTEIMKKKLIYILGVAACIIGATSCQKGDLQSNPNAVGDNGTVPVSLILNHLTYDIYAGGGVVDGRPGAVSEIPWDQEFIWSQYFVSNYQYYRGSNAYSWSVTATAYDILKYATKMDEQNAKQYGGAQNVYSAMSKFFRAYAFIWLTQRVGDIPMTQAGDATNLTPAYDKQHDVYKNSLALLDSANIIFNKVIGTANAQPGNKLDANGDVFGLTNLQWQKVVNTYRLRVLISLSKRADDNADLNIKQQFATIFNNPTQYPIMTANSDNLKFTYNLAYNPYPIFARGNAPYNNFANVGKTYLDITTATHDPRTFIAATPAPAQLTAGKTVSDFTAYVGADINLPLATLFTNGSTPATSIYSYANAIRYYTDKSGGACEPYILLGYPELCFNIAEAINRGWISGSSASWYTNGINASLSIYGLSQGQTYTVGDVNGKTLGTVNIDIATFLADPGVAYAGDNADGLKQILTQKYVAFFNNSGWEAYYNWRRTGVPAFAQGGAGIGTPSNQIPIRWQYPTDEATFNASNCSQAIQNQYGGTDDINQAMWLIK
jgi:hypothetical protein